tara:strand:- start:27 stop:785 length:759 start_codon:yes stop_codon:yes gene_type:complete
MRVKQVLTVPKEICYPESNEDFFNMHDSGFSCALSDGASESYDSKTWAKLLCQCFIRESKRKFFGNFYKHKQIKNLIGKSRFKFFEIFSKQSLSWSQQAAFDRGSFASLTGLVDHGDSIEILSIGDSVALWQPTKESVNSHFLTETSDFVNQPLLISTKESSDNFFFMQEDIAWATKKIKKKEVYDGSIYLLTDAIAIKILDLIKNGEMLFALNVLRENYSNFESWILSERRKKQIKIDDTTVAWIKINETS